MSARTVPRGGRWATGVPTATARPEIRYLRRRPIVPPLLRGKIGTGFANLLLAEGLGVAGRNSQGTPQPFLSTASESDASRARIPLGDTCTGCSRDEEGWQLCATVQPTAFRK